MAKRFGRNQRRKMREALAQAQAEVEAATYNAKVARELGRSARNTLLYVGDALRRFELTACLPATTQEVPGDPRLLDGYRVVPMHHPLKRLKYWHPGDDPVSAVAHPVVDLSVLTHAIERDAQQGATYVHLFLKGRGQFHGRWTYAASDKVWARGIPPDARQRMAAHMVAELLEVVDRSLTSTGRALAHG